MRKAIPLFPLAFVFLLIAGCRRPAGPDPAPVPAAVPEPAPVVSDTLHVRKVEDLPEEFFFGMDLSSVIAEENSGVRYFGFDGQERDVFLTLAEAGITHIRVRIWNDPFDADGRGFGGGNCDIDTAVRIGRRAADAGLRLIADFHYSDFWADPGKQMCPRAWEGMPIEEKTEAAYLYTKDCLLRLRGAGADVAIVQIGNETNGALAGEKTWFNIQYLMQAGARAAREIFPEALVALHFTNPENSEAYLSYAKKLAYYDVDYDVFASSYYPYWHGTTENLTEVLSTIRTTYGKQVMVMETSYAYTPEDSDFFGNTISAGSTVVRNYPYTVQGQANAVRDVIAAVRDAGGIGVVYWEGAWITVGGSGHEENRRLWEEHGSGWASSFAAAYDPDDAGKYYGGSAVDNQAFFDPHGRPLESLKVFGLVRTGNGPAPVPDALEDASLEVDLAGTIELPATVDAILTDNSRSPVPVEWSVTDEALADMQAGGVGDYEVSGTAGGMPVRCRIAVRAFNHLENAGFETGVPDPWVVTDLRSADELYVEEKTTDSLSGRYHMHFWSAAKNSVEFTLEQTPEALPAGTYRFSLSVMGGDAGEQELFLYAKIDGETVSVCPVRITSYAHWDTGVIDRIPLGEGQALTVGVYVRCEGAGNGAWGKIDDATLCTVAE